MDTINVLLISVSVFLGILVLVMSHTIRKLKEELRGQESRYRDAIRQVWEEYTDRVRRMRRELSREMMEEIKKAGGSLKEVRFPTTQRPSNQTEVGGVTSDERFAFHWYVRLVLLLASLNLLLSLSEVETSTDPGMLLPETCVKVKIPFRGDLTDVLAYVDLNDLKRCCEQFLHEIEQAVVADEL